MFNEHDNLAMTLCLCFDIFCTELKTFLQQFFVCQYDRKAPHLQGVFFNWYPPKKLKYGKPRLGESTLT